ncbi:MAG: response regulator, partial [Bacteroidota bacterium]
MIRIIIVEDEILAANKLERLLGKSSYPIQVLQRLTSLSEAIRYFASSSNEGADLIFMDINLGDGSCFELFEQLEIDIPIIFTTAYDQYA